MLLLPDDGLDARRDAATDALRPLATSLARDLEPLLGRQPDLPAEKALLARAGGRCEACATTLAFDPLAPHEHRCLQCGRVHRGPPHHRWWVTWYHLWLAERAVHAAVLYRLGGDARHARLARGILEAYAERYLTYPNRDNVLGPTRLFFSTYLESVWLLQVCLAVDGLDEPELRDTVVARVVEPSRALIGAFDEGMSNRQAWHNAALLAAGRLLNDTAGCEHAVRGRSGLTAHLSRGLLADGTWYEGENYHLFAHRGLWYGVTLAETAGIPLRDDLVARFEAGFVTPFLTALPDLTMPSRKDSPYAVSLRQWWVADWCELGLARRDDPALLGALGRLYDGAAPEGETGRARSTADVERNRPAVRLGRADLSWRALLFARPHLPGAAAHAPRSVSLPGQGFTVFRRGDAYVALDWGVSGGGHGHPDRLNLLFADGDTRWLDDLGTGSYVDRSLHWYRSTLAHNAPLVNGRSQERVDGILLALSDGADEGRVQAAVTLDGVDVERTLVVTDDYFVDEVRWRADRPVRFELPMHFAGEPAALDFRPGTLDGGGGLEDGFAFAREVRAARSPAGATVAFDARRGGRQARGWCWSPEDTEWFRALAPGQPADEERAFSVCRCAGSGGVLRAVWSWSARVSAARFAAGEVTVTVDGTPRTHVMPGVTTRPPAPARAAGERKGMRPVALSPGRLVTFDLGEPHYRRSEESWAEAGRPTARVSVLLDGRQLVVEARVPGPLVFVPADAANPYDNEEPDINGHGVQLYVRTADDGGAWLAVPEPGLAAGRVRRLHGWGDLPVEAEWRPESTGFAVRLSVGLPAAPDRFALDVLVNETAPGRERRRGQLVLSGAVAEWVYLRGDRHDPGRLVPFAVTS